MDTSPLNQPSNDLEIALPAPLVSRELLTIEGMAHVLGVAPTTVYRWVGLGKIPFIKLERHLRFQPDVVIEHFRARTQDQRVPCFQSDNLLKNLVVGRKSKRSLKISESKAAGSYPEKG